jgi:hypothetical protein
MAVLWVRSIVAGFPLQVHQFDPRSGHIGFGVDNVESVHVITVYVPPPPLPQASFTKCSVQIHLLGLVQ